MPSAQRLKWPHDRCILCFLEGPLTYEHIIPEYLGGRLEVDFLCASCNSTMGTREAALRRDPRIWLAAEHLRSEIPEIAASVAEGQFYLVEREGGRTRGVVKSGQFRVSASREADGSLIQPTPTARRTLAAWLAERHEPANVVALLERFDESPDDTMIELDETLRVIKRTHGNPRPALGGDFAHDGPLVKIAYEFLACHMGSVIYGPEFDGVRAAIKAPPGLPGVYRIESVQGEKYRAMHGLALQAGVPHVIVQIRFFGWVGFLVHLPTIRWAGPRYAYTLDLKAREGCCHFISEGSGHEALS